MGKHTFETYSLTALKTEAADVKLGWVTLALEFLSLPGSPMPGNLNTVLRTLFGQYASSRDYLGSFVGTKMSIKVGSIVAADDHLSNDKVNNLLAAQTMMLAPDLVLVDPKLGYDQIRHNYQWGGTLIEVQTHFGRSIADRSTFCVVHPDEKFEPIALVSGMTIRKSCTQANPNFSNEIRGNISHEERMKILKAREALIQSRKGRKGNS